MQNSEIVSSDPTKPKKVKSDKKIQGNSEYESEHESIWLCDTLGIGGGGGEGWEGGQGGSRFPFLSLNFQYNVYEREKERL